MGCLAPAQHLTTHQKPRQKELKSLLTPTHPQHRRSDMSHPSPSSSLVSLSTTTDETLTPTASTTDLISSVRESETSPDVVHP